MWKTTRRLTCLLFNHITSKRNFNISSVFHGDKQVENFDPDSYESEYLALRGRLLSEQPHRCLIVCPREKRGTLLDPEEARELVAAIPGWSVHDILTLSVPNTLRKQVFGTGQLEDLKGLLQKQRDISAVFVNISSLKLSQQNELEERLGVSVLDRERVVLGVLGAAAGGSARLRLAELNWLSRRGRVPASAAASLAAASERLTTRLADLEAKRSLLRRGRERRAQPLIALVGYTNAGKTSLARLLTGDQSLKPADRLFATAEVTAHAGRLPSGLIALYADTVGLLTEVPRSLALCWAGTLEDARLADVLLHVMDLGAPGNRAETQAKAVERALAQLGDCGPVITVGNKADLVSSGHGLEVDVRVSARTGQGLTELQMLIEQEVMRVRKMRQLTIRLPTGSDEVRWLYKNAVVTGAEPDPSDAQFQHVSVIVTEQTLNQFYSVFVQNN